MASEKRFFRVPPQAFTADGGSDGKITIADTCLFKVKQMVILKATGVPDICLEVKHIPNATCLYVGPIGGSIKTRTDVSAYTTALSATIEAKEQNRPTVPQQEIERATFEEEPVVARRSVLIDKYGDPYSDTNPIPVDANITTSVDPCPPNPFFSQGADTVSTTAFEEVFTYTSTNNNNKILQVEVSVGTHARVRVKIDGTTVRERRTVWGNAVFEFPACRPLLNTEVISVDVKVNRLCSNAPYDVFTSLSAFTST